MSGARLARSVAVLLLAGACSVAGRGPSADPLERGDAAFRTGDYAAAARAYEAHLARTGGEADETVYLRLAVIHLMLAPRTDPERGEAVLERMIDAHPESRLREVAETILSLRSRLEAEREESAGSRDRTAALERRIEELEARIEALKAIDLESRQPPD